MMRISSFDILNQRSAIDGVRNRTLAGGVITIIASGVAAVLFLAELYMYVKVDVVHHLTVAVPKGGSLYNKNQGQMSEKARARLKNKGKVKVAVKLTFPHLDCTLLELVYDGNGGWGYTSDEIENIHEVRDACPNLCFNCMLSWWRALIHNFVYLRSCVIMLKSRHFTLHLLSLKAVW